MKELSIQEGKIKGVEKISGQLSGETFQFMTSRRGLIKGIYGFLAAVGLGSLGYGLYRFLAPGGGAAPPLEVLLSQIPAGGSYSFRYGNSPGILIQEEEGSFRAFSLVCTHLACTVLWNPEKREFYCPCHDGLFDAEGRVLSGPPPSPLERLKVRVKEDIVLVGGA